MTFYSQVENMWRDCINSQIDEVNKTSLTRPLLLKCLYQAKKVVSHVFCVSIIDLPLSMVFLLDYVSTVRYLFLFILLLMIGP
jgi:hypothetical protein